MVNTAFSIPRKEGLKVLFLGAHSDDIEIGCGGTVLKLIEDYDIAQVKWVVFTSNEIRKKEAMASAKRFLEPVKTADIEVFDFQDGFLPSAWSDVKSSFERLKSNFDPDIIFTHYREDLHQDHRTINELTWNTFRNHLILEYEIPKYDGDMGKPNLFVPLKDEQVQRKREIVFDSFESQLNKHWFDDSLMNAIMRIRGMECASEAKYAEAFYTRKMII
jgi:LmbE family N-acetylglucosaminyl deacetylase